MICTEPAGGAVLRRLAWASVMVASLVSAVPSPASAQDRPRRAATPQTSDRAILDRARVLRKPKYPEDTAESGLEGTVAVRVLLTANGEVVSARAISGPDELRAAATGAVKAWEFTTSSAPDSISGTLVFRFAPGEPYAEILGVRAQELAAGDPAREPPTPAIPLPDRREAARASVKGEPDTPPREVKHVPAEPVRITTVELLGKVERRVSPRYPSAAANARIEGSVVVEIVIDEKGKVSEARALSGPMMLREPSVTAAREWLFKPTLEGGKPIRVISTILFNFKL